MKVGLLICEGINKDSLTSLIQHRREVETKRHI